MAEQDLHVVELRNDYYRDNFGKVIWIMLSTVIAITLLGGISFYLHINKPVPVTFTVEPEWRVKPQVPLNNPYVLQPDLLQWVSDALLKVFVFDFIHYNSQLKNASQYFTSDGWKIFLNQLNIYANYNTVQASKLFVNATPGGAPFILQEGLLQGRYAWWVQMPINLEYSGYTPPLGKTLVLQVLVVRVPTLNNLNGVGIDNIIVANNNVKSTTQTGNGQQ